MARTPSKMIDLGTPCPDFALPDTEGRTVRRDDFAAAPGLLIMTICNHCPFVLHIREGLAAFAREYAERGLAIVGINANDAQAYPADGPEQMAIERTRAGYVFPYLFDESQAVVKALGAACTPDFFLFGPDGTLVYRGQFDDARPGNGQPITGSHLRAACDAVLAGQPVTVAQWPSLGCNIKWKPGNEPTVGFFP